MTGNGMRHGGRILVDQLALHGVDHVFCVPGESYLAALDALHDSPIALTVCRQEGGAAMMADAYGKLTGRPGVCFVTRGPGAANAAAGVHVAAQDSTPMILLVGQVERAMRGREAFQELDYRAVFGAMAKWTAEIDDPARIPELISRAFHVATSGRPGPVILALPEDMLIEEAAVADARPYRTSAPAPAPSDLAQLEALLAAASRPLAIAGGSRWSQQAVDDLVAFSERHALPVAVSFRRQSLFPADHAHYVGDLTVGADPALVALAAEADLILLLGGRLSELPSQSYELLAIPDPRQTLVHVHPGPEEVGRVYAPDLGIAVPPGAFLEAAQTIAPPADTGSRAAFAARGRRAYLDWSETPTGVPGRFNLGEAVRALRAALPPDAIVANGAGNYAAWVHRFFRFRRHGTQLAPTSGSMGYGLPAGVAAGRVLPGRQVVVFAGDGCFLMTGQEFATAVQYDIPLVVIVVDNGMYGTIRMHQERNYPGRVVGTTLRNPDFAALAVAFGGHGARVERTEDFLPAFEEAVASGRPAIVHCIVDPEAITPARTLSQIAAQGGGPDAASGR